VYQKILVPLDGSEHSKRALNEAISLSKMTNGTITLLNVQPHHASLASPVSHHTSEVPQSIVLTEGQRIVQAAGLQVNTLLLQGNVVDQIVKTAKDDNSDLIIVGARGLSKFEELLLGSVSHGVVEKAPCPVIVTR
jgi:nucleotide-binding universal stress UspA family protein